MIYDNSESDLFMQYYDDCSLDFLTKAKIDTEQSKEKIKELRNTLNEIELTIERVEKSNGHDDLWSKYCRGELPHVHISKDPLYNVFMDALCIQADRIRDNILKAYPNMTREELSHLMFGDRE